MITVKEEMENTNNHDNDALPVENLHSDDAVSTPRSTPAGTQCHVCSKHFRKSKLLYDNIKQQQQ
jgi:hypothetical protein